MYYLKNIWVKMRYSNFLRLIFDGLTRVGIKIQPFYLVLEGLFNGGLPHLEAGFDGYDVGFLGPQDMKAISTIPGQNISEEKLLLKLEEGKKCFGVKCRGELVAFTWCDLNEFSFNGYRFPLKENEAYLFDAYTLMSFRGKGIAPYMRYHVYKELAELGRDKLYSITIWYNTPSIRFKKKLNAKFLELGLFVELFKKWRFSSQLESLK